MSDMEDDLTIIDLAAHIVAAYVGNNSVPAAELPNLIFDVVEKLGGKFQVLITDHPDFSDDVRFQAALRERWRDGLKLVPEDWPRSV